MRAIMTSTVRFTVSTQLVHLYTSSGNLRQPTGLLFIMTIYDLTAEPAPMGGCALVCLFMTAGEQAEQLALSALRTTELDSSLHVNDGRVEDTTKFECLRVAAESSSVYRYPV